MRSLPRLLDAFLIASLALAVHAWLFLDQPVLAEARMFLHQHGNLGPLGPLTIVRGIFEPTGYNSRFVSMLSFDLMADLFGYRAVPMNAIQIGLVIGCALLLLEYVARLAGSRRTGRVVALLWLFSAGTANALTWQATNHEKLALFFSLGTVLYLACSPEGTGPRRLVATNVVLTLLTALSLNSKEIAFCLVVILPVQAWMTAGSRSLRARVRSLARVALPVAYSSAFVVVYFLRLEPRWSAHAFAGAPAAGVFPYGAALFNLVSDRFATIAWSDGGLRAWAAALLMAASATTILALIIMRVRQRPWRENGAGEESRSRNAAAVILGMWFATSFAIILNQDASPYCLLVPSTGFLGLLVLAAEDLAVSLGGKKLRAATVALLLAWYGVTFIWMALPGHAVGRHVEACRRVARSHATIRASLPQEVTGPFGFLLEGGDSRMRWLFFDSSERSVMNFVLQRPGDFAHFLATPESDRIPPGAYTFRYDRAFNLRNIRQGERILFQAPARPVLN